MTDTPLLIDVTNGIATLRKNRPDKRNAMSDALLNALDAFFGPSRWGAAVAVTGVGGHHCAFLEKRAPVFR